MVYAASLFALVAGMLGIIVWKQRKAITTLNERRKEVVVEEHRMFSFLHGLGEVLQSSKTKTQLYQYILEGAMRVVEAREGALYLVNESGTKLVPRALSPGCPALFSNPETPVEALDAEQLRSHLQLISLTLDETTIVGECLATRKGMHLDHLQDHASLAESRDDRVAGPAMLAPLYFGDTNLGTLVVLEKLGKFSSNDFAVFRSLADQCSLALGTSQLSRQASAQRRLEGELQTAREVQRILLPDDAPPLHGFVMAGRNRAARIVSGDYHDFIPLDNNHVGVAVADVSGKGLPASLMMAMGRSVLRANAQPWLSPSKALAAVNQILFPDIREDMFISMVYLILKEDFSEVTMSRAGHDPPLIYRAASREIEELAPPGLAVGVDEGPAFERVTGDLKVQMATGDTILLYTDGLNEALNAEGDEFGLERICETFSRYAHKGADAVLDRLFEAAEEFVGEFEQSDDMTIVVLEKTAGRDKSSI
jgi:sigma-B regulation protein RsbU (phosphoserine phosphatase)